MSFLCAYQSNIFVDHIFFVEIENFKKFNLELLKKDIAQDFSSFTYIGKVKELFVYSLIDGECNTNNTFKFNKEKIGAYALIENNTEKKYLYYNFKIGKASLTKYYKDFIGNFPVFNVEKHWIYDSYVPKKNNKFILEYVNNELLLSCLLIKPLKQELNLEAIKNQKKLVQDLINSKEMYKSFFLTEEINKKISNKVEILIKENINNLNECKENIIRGNYELSKESINVC